MLNFIENWKKKLIRSGLSKELPRFLVAGFSAVGTDALFYWLLLHVFSHSPAKALSFMSGTVVAFVINKYWTFGRKEKSFAEVMKFASLYTVTLGANVAVNKLSLLILPGFVTLAFLAATGTSTVLNFIGQKWWVFRSQNHVSLVNRGHVFGLSSLAFSTLAVLAALVSAAGAYKSWRAGMGIWSVLRGALILGVITFACGVLLTLFANAMTRFLVGRRVLPEERRRLEDCHGAGWVDAWLKTTTLSAARVRNLIILMGLSLSAISLALFACGHPTAYEYPSIDMGPYFSRYFAPGFLVGDFFTEATFAPSPRQVFGLTVVFISRAIGIDWYAALFLLKSMFVVVVPALFYWFIVSRLTLFFEDRAGKMRAAALAFAGALLVFSDRVIGLFSPAWWKPIFYFAAPQTLSLSLGLSAGILSGAKGLWARRLSLVFWFFAVLVHPQIGIGIFVFWLLTTPMRQLKVWRVVVVGSAILSSALSLKFLFGEGDLPPSDFVRYYVINAHPAHYLPSEFGSFISLPWFISFFLIVACLLGTSLFNWRAKRVAAAKAGFLLVSAYIGCVALQYLFVELYPIKFMAVLGPSRFLMFGFWACLFAVSYTVSASVSPLSFVETVARSRLSDSPTVYAAAFVVLILAAVAPAALLDDPWAEATAKYGRFSAWVETTPVDSMFIVPPSTGLTTDMRMIFERSLFVGGGFPFNESWFSEQDRRNSLVYGNHDDLSTMTGKELYDRTANYYRSKGPRYWSEVCEGEGVDFVVIESSFNGEFKGIEPAYSDDDLSVYGTAQLGGSVAE